jgi:acyl-CoA reductase-like NAD-dependent aldehyde dehydrogenase
MKDSYPLYLANKPATPNLNLEVTDKYSGKVVTRVPLADDEMIYEAISAACTAAEPMRRLPSFRRREILEHCVRKFQEHATALANTLCIEAGKPIKDARGEVTRLIDTFRIAAAECGRATGEVMDLEASPRAAGYRGMWKRVPIGPVSLISPFNFPLNLAAHKIAPAIAAGCPFILKPASYTPVGALLIGEILAETGLPDGAFSILPCRRDEAGRFTTDERLKLISFTGSPDAGWAIKAKAGRKTVVLELGGNAAVIVDEGADLDDVVSRILVGAYYQSGQSCISVQRIFAHRSLYVHLRDRLTVAVRDLKAGDPRDEAVSIGPLITLQDAERVESWIHKAVASGGRLLAGGGRNGAIVEASLMENVADSEPLACQEAFGPVAIMEPFTEFDAALKRVNASRYGLQAGVFTRDLNRAMKAWDELEVGGVIVNDIPSWRVDHMPYGGVKESGLGREGLRWAIEEMTEIRLLVIRDRS